MSQINMTAKPNKGRKSMVGWITKVAILAAVAFILMLFEFPIPIAPPFYKLGLDEVAVMICGFSLGPLAATVCEALKILLNLVFNGTQTAGVGELMNFFIGLSYVLPAAWYYKYHKDQKGAWIALLIGTISLVICGFFINWLIALPMYSYFYGLPLDIIVSMGTAIFPAVTNTFTFALFCVVPFNLIKGIVSSLVTLLLYKRIGKLLNK